MLIWLIAGISVAAVFATILIRNAESDDKRRKLVKRGSLPDNWR